ncbi:MAG: M20 family metallopeptidase [Deltaproteobacteria bacterium]|nr:M20 family metallopeptidase [Deltaproteobacteria bacterium]
MKTDYTSLELARELIGFNTINPPGNEEALALFIGDLFEKEGFMTSYHAFEKGRTSLIVKKKNSINKLPLSFTGHLDTVPLGKELWQKDPFIGELEGDRLFGRGASDMKGGLAAVILAVLEANRILKGELDLQLIFTACEETACLGAAFLASKEGLLEKSGALVVAEPTSNYPKIGHKGTLWLSVKYKGITAHGSMPEKGDNAIYKAVTAIQKIKDFKLSQIKDPLFGINTINVGTFHAGSSVNTVPDSAVFEVDIRTLPGQSSEEILKKIKPLLGKEAEISILTKTHSLKSDPDDPWLKRVFKILEDFLPQKPQIQTAVYVTDASILTPALGNPPTLILGPGEAEMCHKKDEFTYLSKIDQAKDLYLRIIRDW